MKNKDYELSILEKSKKWEEEQLKKRLKELKQAGIELTVENIPLIVEEMSFRVRSKKHPDECKVNGQGPYEIGISCHPNVKDLNCFLCACPQYNLVITSEGYVGECRINSKFKKYTSSDVKTLDCSDCVAYHNPKAVEVFLRNNIDRINNTPQKTR